MSAAIETILKNLGIETKNHACSTGNQWNSPAKATAKAVFSPVDGKEIAKVRYADKGSYHALVNTASEAFTSWRMMPAPKRGEIVRQISEQLRAHKDDLGHLVSYEMGKSLQEGWGEVQRND